MSGIFGLVDFSAKAADDQLLADMLFLLEKQGPDDQAYWRGDQATLGHALLKTTRESEHEAQPSTLDGEVWLTADARIDGRTELISKLRGKGVTVDISATDDYLILHAYAIWGEDCLDHLIGDFSFILWDGVRKRLFCATDQIGVAPLYYAEVPQGLVVSNNVNAIRMHPDISDVLNEQAIGDYLLFRMNHTAGSTSFRDIKKLPAGHSLVAAQDGVNIQRYWSIPETDYVRRSKGEYLEAFDDLFRQAVADRLRTDGAGTHLSGGMDSTSIAAMLTELKTDDKAGSIHAYTHIPSMEELSLEKPFADKVAKKLGIPHHIIKGNEDNFGPDIDDVADLPPEPSFARRATPRFQIFSDSAQKSRTFFAGYGGDPLLLPINSYWSDLRQSGQWANHITDLMRHIKMHGKPPNTIIPVRLKRRKRAGGLSSWPLPGWLNEDFVKRGDLADRYVRYRGSASVNQNARIDMQAHPLWRRVFEWHDPAYSSLPMKVRFPFFDIRLIALFQTISPYPWMHGKYLVRAIMEDRLPRDVVERPKTAFPANPILAKIDEKGAPDWAEALSLSGGIAEFVNVAHFLEHINDTGRLTEADTRGIVRASTLNHWLEKYRELGGYVGENDAKLQRYKCRKG